MDGSVQRETTSGVLGIGLGLALIVGAFFVLVRMAERDADGEALLAEAFVVGELPFDFEILEARTLTTGERVVVLGPPAEAGSSDRGDGERAPPERLFLVRHSEAAIEGVIERQFRRVSYGDSVREPGKQVDLPLAGGRLRWGALAPSFVHSRRKHSDSHRDSVRVNLYRPERPWIAYAVWAPDQDGSEEGVQALLTSLQPREEAQQ